MGYVLMEEYLYIHCSEFLRIVFYCCSLLSTYYTQLFEQYADIFKLFHEIWICGELSFDLLI